MAGFENVPAVIRTACEARRLEVHFLPGLLANIADVHVTGETVERIAPGIAYSGGPDLVPARHADEWIAGRESCTWWECPSPRRCAGSCRAGYSDSARCWDHRLPPAAVAGAKI